MIFEICSSIIYIALIITLVSINRKDVVIEILNNHREIFKFKNSCEDDIFYTELVNHFFMIYLCQHKLDKDVMKCFKLDIKDAFFTIPELNNHYHQNKMFYPKRFHQFITNTIAKEN